MASAKPHKPKRRKSVRKEQNIHIRVTDAQKDAITAAAERSGLGASSWMLMLAMREVEKAEGGGR
jgi:uncharacterized protein (DUF1778 family)